jgi:uncharacterized protein (TIGR02145 family)
MNIRIKNLLLIGSIVASVILSGCNKNDESANNETGTFTDSRDNKTYKWVKIGTQVWMAENLAYTGTDIQHITGNSEWNNNEDLDAWCYYENNEDNAKIYGVLYQWEAAKSACPIGWHLPTDEEWTQLENYLKENAYSYDGVIGNSGIAKSLATNSGWDVSDNQGAIGNSDFSEYRNKTGFSALPSGRRSSYGDFSGLRYNCAYWSATEYSSSNAYIRGLNYSAAKVNRKDYRKLNGYSVRCVKD